MPVQSDDRCGGAIDRQFTPLPDRDLTLLEFVAKVSGRGLCRQVLRGRQAPRAGSPRTDDCHPWRCDAELGDMSIALVLVEIDVERTDVAILVPLRHGAGDVVDEETPTLVGDLLS